ncbi:MAG: hypothetical protein ABSC02_08135 [Acidobacteriota bacterium]|jgi:hypothetical protein
MIVEPAFLTSFLLWVRMPNRNVSSLYQSLPNANGITSIAVNGSTVKSKIEKGYAVITRDWKAGDRIDLVLPMKIQRIQASDKIAADQGRVAL